MRRARPRNTLATATRYALPYKFLTDALTEADDRALMAAND